MTWPQKPAGGDPFADCEPTSVRSVRLPVSTWKRLEQEAKAAGMSVNELIRKRVG